MHGEERRPCVDRGADLRVEDDAGRRILRSARELRDAREASVEYGERYLEVVTEATIRMVRDIERTMAAMPPR